MAEEQAETKFDPGCGFYNAGMGECEKAEIKYTKTNKEMCDACRMPPKIDVCKHFALKKTSKQGGLLEKPGGKRYISIWNCKKKMKSKNTDYNGCFKNADNKHPCFEELIVKKKATPRPAKSVKKEEK